MKVFSAVETPQYERVLTALHSMKKKPPRSLIIEGGNEETRELCALYWFALCRCSAQNAPCMECSSCKTIEVCSNAPTEYAQIEKKHKQENGSYFFLGDIAYFNSREGLYIKQISQLKEMLTEEARSGQHSVLFAEFHKTHSTKEITNALLKTMEEPRDSSFFVITVPERTQVSQTIISRSWVLTLPWSSSATVHLQSSLIDALTVFLETGKGWFSVTGSKAYSCSVSDVEMLIMSCKVSMCQAVKKNGISPLARLFHSERISRMDICMKIFEQAEEALRANVQPVLVGDVLATKLYTFLHAKKL